MTQGPTFEGLNGVTFNPVRLMFMMGAVWRLSLDRGGRPLEVLEIGSWAGASALTFGQALARHNPTKGRITCIDPWQPFVDRSINPAGIHASMDDALADGTIFETFRQNMTHLPAEVRHEVMRGFSDKILPTLPRGSYDLIYIDGDHCYQAVHRDISNAIHLVADGGILCGDDLELQAHQVNAEIARANPSLDCAYATHLQQLYHPGVTLAVGELLGRVTAWEGFWAMRKRGTQWEAVSLEGMPFDIPAHLPPRALIGLKTYLMKRGIM